MVMEHMVMEHMVMEHMVMEHMLLHMRLPCWLKWFPFAFATFTFSVHLSCSDLSDNGFSGAIPPSLGRLTGMTYL